MPDTPFIALSRLREIGWSAWDPIGLADSDCPRDEYDAYLLQAASRLRRGEPASAVAKYLDGIATDHMGLGPSTEAGRRAAERTAALIKDYLDELPSGALKVR